MIQPNTLCLIRGVPHEHLGSEFNGRVVTVTGFKSTHPDGSTIYWIEPELYDQGGRQFTGARAQWLWPFSGPDALKSTNKIKETA